MSRLGLGKRKLLLLRPCIVSILVAMAIMPGSITSTWESRDTGKLPCTGWISFQLIIYGVFCGGSLCTLCHPKRPQSLPFPQIPLSPAFPSCDFPNHHVMFWTQPMNSGKYLPLAISPLKPNEQTEVLLDVLFPERLCLHLCSSGMPSSAECPLLLPRRTSATAFHFHFHWCQHSMKNHCKPSSSVFCYFHPVLGNLPWDHTCELREN